MTSLLQNRPRQERDPDPDWMPVDRNGLRWQMAPAIAVLEPFLKRLDDPEALFGPSAPRLGRTGKELTETVLVTLPEWPHGGLVAKRYLPKTRWHPLKDWFRGSAAVRAFQRGLLLRRLGIPTANVLAASARSHNRRGISYLLTEEVRDARMLRDCVRDDMDPVWRRRLALELGRLMARLHDASIEHADPSLTNFLVARSPPARPQLILIDLDGLRRRPHMTPHRAALGLRRLAARAHVSTRERLWCLTGYCAARQIALDPRDLARRIGPVVPRPSSLPPPRERHG
jgi:tRNA A-37 threonylcarbamoyl transferase component Bud32